MENKTMENKTMENKTMKNKTMKNKDFNFVFLKGMTISAVELTCDTVTFTTLEGRKFFLHHGQDCCESVNVESILGDLSHLWCGEIIEAKEEISNENPPGAPKHDYQDSFTWTTFTLTTPAGSVRIRWYGESNGYYSESVSCVELLS